MEASTMEETNKSEAHLTSAAAFVEGGIQEACDDACSICLEAFCDSDPSTVTSCKHEFHLQCILEWCQRSSQCPMCWQPISLKDPTSQELLDGVEQERNFRLNPSRNATIFRHPTLGDFELQHLPAGANDAELEERIIQHLAAAAAMGQARHSSRRENRRNRTTIHGRPQFLVFSPHPNTPSASPPPDDIQEGEASPAIMLATTSPSPAAGEDSLQNISPTQIERSSGSVPESNLHSTNQQGSSLSDRRSSSQSVPIIEDRAGPSDFQSFSDSLKSRLNAVSIRYKDSIVKSTRGWREKLFSRNTSMADIGSGVRREVNAGIATVSRMMERLETKDVRTSSNSESTSLRDGSVSESNTRQISESGGNNPLRETNKEGSGPAVSTSN